MRNLEIIKLFWPLPLPKKSNFEFPHHTRISSLQFQSMMLFRIYQHFCYNYGAFFIKSEQVCIELSIEKNGVYYTLQKHMEDNAQDIQHDKYLSGSPVFVSTFNSDSFGMAFRNPLQYKFSK
ncbi:unnamed protein product [Rhizophagus irregularis]|nr:unnamed protein product [Rhizophagus irregularis]